MTAPRRRQPSSWRATSMEHRLQEWVRHYRAERDRANALQRAIDAAVAVLIAAEQKETDGNSFSVQILRNHISDALVFLTTDDKKGHRQ